jgi:Spy/CpxP family protein refolding chaperone
MKSKHKIISAVVFSALFAFSTSLWAQVPDAKMEKKIEERVEKMKSKLNLSDAQVSQVKSIIEESKPQMIADKAKLEASPKADREALHSQMDRDRDATKNKIFAILTPAQQAKAGEFFKHHEK